MTNASDYVSLPGEANVFWGEESVGRSALKRIAPGQEFELSSVWLGALLTANR